jgi:O-antigen biosynthesis protein
VDNSPCVICELLRLGLPFIAASTGGIPEILAETDQARLLFPPTESALAAKVAEVLDSNGWAPGRSRMESSQIENLWLAWFQRLAQSRSKGTTSPSVRVSMPSVTVAVTHYERPKLLDQNLRALSLQTDPDFKLILVDDGSKSEAAVAFLESVESRYAHMSPRIVRQQNRYLGAARNTAVRNTDTPYIIFLDDDNIPFPNMVKVFKRAISSSQADVVSCQMQLFRDPSNEPDLGALFVGDIRPAFSTPWVISTKSTESRSKTGNYIYAWPSRVIRC